MLQTYLLHSSPPRVLSSSGDLIPTDISSVFLFDQFPFLEAIWASVIKSLDEEQFVHIPFVHNPHPKLVGYYHFKFTSGAPQSSSILLHIINCTNEAMNKREGLQKKNEQAILK